MKKKKNAYFQTVSHEQILTFFEFQIITTFYTFSQGA